VLREVRTGKVKRMAVVIVRRWDDSHTVLGSEKSGRRDKRRRKKRCQSDISYLVKKEGAGENLGEAALKRCYSLVYRYD
jgi:hypothetical protein